MELLRYDHVDISYNGVPAIQDVSFTLEPGEILGIVGESGCGKSTLLKAAMGLLGDQGLVTRGDIWYKGLNLPDLPDKIRRTINGPELGMIFQNAGTLLLPYPHSRGSALRGASGARSSFKSGIPGSSVSIIG